jgi:signal transduction histidine kinase
MTFSTDQLLAVIDGARAAASLPGQPSERAKALAAVVQAAWLGIAACRLDSPGGRVVTALDINGRPSAELAAVVENVLAGSVQVATIKGKPIHVVAIESGGQRLGALAASIPTDDSPALAAVARTVADVLYRDAIVEDLADRDRLADMGELVGPATHEFNNFLNALMLQLAVIEMSSSAALKDELQGLKRQCKQVAAVVRQLQQCRRRRTGEVAPVCLNRAIRDAIEATEPASAGQRGGPPVQLFLADRLPLVSGPAADVRRICRFLLNGAASAVGGGVPMFFKTLPAGEGAVLRLEAAGNLDGSFSRLLEKPVDCEGARGLEMAACQSLVRRLGGAIRAEATPCGEALVVELPAAAPK